MGHEKPHKLSSRCQRWDLAQLPMQRMCAARCPAGTHSLALPLQAPPHHVQHLHEASPLKLVCRGSQCGQRFVAINPDRLRSGQLVTHGDRDMQIVACSRRTKVCECFVSSCLLACTSGDNEHAFICRYNSQAWPAQLRMQQGLLQHAVRTTIHDATNVQRPTCTA